MNHSLPEAHRLSRTLIACLIISLMILSPLAPLTYGAPKASRQPETASSLEPAAPFAPDISATKVDSFPDLDADGKAAPGETITYDVNITNNGADDATDVNFSDTIDANTTLVPGSLKVSPLAFPDAFAAAQNTPLVVGAPGVLTNDTGLPAPTAVAIAGGATAQGGTVTLNTDGSFTYNPPTGFEGSDSFTYTVTNGLTPNDSSLVTLNVDAPPSVTATTPTNGATDAAQNTNITITFSEAVNVTGDWFQISCANTGVRNVADTSVTGGPTTFTINPTTDFDTTELCTVTVFAAQVSDQDLIDPPDNMAANFVFSFTTTAQELAPTVSATTPTNGAVDQPTNTDITVTFSEPVNVTGEWFSIACPTSGARNVAATAVTGGPTTFTINPNVDFAPGEVCTVTIVAAQVADQDSNDPPDNMAANFVFSFTMDNAPAVTATTPANNATQVANNTNISITFNEAVDVTGNWFQIVGATSGTKNVADTVVTGGPTTFDINPADFANGELVTVTVFAAQVSDQDTNDPPQNMTANFVFSFTIDQAPSVTATTPTNGATGVAINSNVSITFSEAVNVTGEWFSIACPTSGARNVAATVVTGGPTTFTINPNADFANGEVCTVTVNAAQVTDQDSGDPPDNMEANFVFSFTTVDIAPTVTATTPTNGATNQPTTTDITVTFSEPVNVTGNWFQIVCTTSGTRNVADTVVTPASPSTSFTINPNTDFTAGESCTVTVNAAQVTDADTVDPPDNMAANFVFSFTMDAAPTVTATTPTNGATQVANNTSISLTFSEPVDVTGNWFQIVGASSGIRNVVDTVVTGGPTTFNIDPSDFTNGELVTVTVFAAQVSDQDTNDPPQNMTANFVFSFTIDNAPSVTATVPTNGATSVAASTDITITFSEAVNVSGDWFQIVCGTQTKNPADTAVTGGPTTFTINPTTDLLPGNICQVTVFAAQVTDQDSGDPPDNMVANFVFSFSVPPVAVNDAYAPTIVGNVGINTDNSTEFSILANDTPATGVTINTSGTSAQGGTVVVAADGKFSYIPAAGFEGADSFTYTITNAAGTSNSATVSFTVAGMIWFINSAAGAGNGRLATPFNSVASFQALNVGGGNNPAAGDNIFIFENASAYTGPITLLSNQKLIGQDATASLAAIAGVSVPADSFPLPAMNPGAPATTLNSSSAGVNAVNLNGAGTGNTIRGLTLTTGSATSKGINGTSFGTLTTADLIISGSGPAVDLTTGSLSGSFNSISSSGGANGIRLSAIGGSSTLGTGSLSGATAEEFLITGANSTVTLTYDGTISTTAAGSRPVSISGKTTSGNVTFNGAVSASSNSSGVNLDNNDGATISFLGGLSLSTGSNTAFNAINGGTVVATQNNTSIVNTLTTTTGTALNVANTNIGASGLTFRSISANGGANGIVLNTTGSAGGLTVTGNSSGLCGGQVSGSPLSITTAPNTADCTGGRIQLTTGADGATSGIGISLTSTSNVSLTRMRLDNHTNFAIKGSSVTGLTLSNMLIDGVNGSTTSPDEGSINITNLLGTSSMTNSTVRGGFEDNISVLNNTGTGTFTITGSTIRDNSTTTGNDGVFGQADPGANLTLKVINSVLQRHRGDHVNTTQSGNGVINTVVTGNTMTFNGTIGQPFDLATTAGGSVTLTTGANFTGTSTFNVSNNNITGAKTAPININNTALTSTLTGIFSGTINGNTIGLTGAVGSGSDGDGIDVTANGNANVTATITNNNVRQWKLLGINMVPRDGAATMNVTVQGNTVGEPSNTTESLQAILLNAGPATTETGNTCANIGGSVAGQPNTFPGTFTAGILPIRVRQRAVNTVFLPGYGGAAFSAPNVTAYLSARNGGAGATATVNNVPGAGGFLNTPGGAPCTGGAAPAASEQESPKVVQPVAMQSEPGLPAEDVRVSERKNERKAAATDSVSSTFSSETVSGPSLDPRDIQRTKRDLGMVLRYSPKDTWAPLARRQEPNATQDKAPRRGINVKPRVSVLAGETVSHSIGTLRAGKTVHIQFQVTVNSPYLGGETVSNQGTVSGSNFTSVLTDDPAVGGANDPTQTPIVQTPNVSVADAQANEPGSGSAPMLFTISLSAPAGASGASVQYATADQAPALDHAVAGVDYTAVPLTTLNFAAGEQFKTVTVNILADGVGSEVDETFLLNLSNPTNANIADGQAIGTIKQGNAAGTFLISEIRTSGPGGAGDDFVEVYNNSDTPVTIAASDASAGFGLFKMGADCTATPVLIGVIPNGTVIPARGHYLFVGSAYSLSNYGGTGAAAGNLTLSEDIESDANVAIFNTSSVANLSSVTRLDAVGFGSNTGGNCDLLREGTTLPPLSGSTLEHSYVRDECGKKGNPAMFGPCPSGFLPVDTNVNNDDFIFVDTAGTNTVAGQRLGAPGPQNIGNPLLRNSTITSLLLDSNFGGPAAPNRVRDTSATGVAPAGTLSVRRRFVNNTGAPVTRLRFRVVDISTIAVTPGVADVRAITSTDVVVSGITDAATCAASGAGSAPCTVTVRGTTLEQPPTQAVGGGHNSSLSAGTITLPTPLAPGASINLQFMLGVHQSGSFKFFFNIEALP